jgi:hypothetical protein
VAFGAAGVRAWPQNFGKACRRPQNEPSDALLDIILGASVEMLLAEHPGSTRSHHLKVTRKKRTDKNSNTIGLSEKFSSETGAHNIAKYGEKGSSVHDVDLFR